MKLAKLAAGVVILAAGAFVPGCAETYEDKRPPVDQLAEGNQGLQSKDVVSATDQMANDLLSLKELNDSSKKWTIVLSSVENHTSDPQFSYNAFTNRLRSQLSQQGHGRVALIENKAKFKDLQNQELEQPADPYGQGGGKASGPVGTNPDYALYITIDEMPNRATSYFLITATMTNLATREQVWNGKQYEVQTKREDAQ